MGYNVYNPGKAMFLQALYVLISAKYLPQRTQRKGTKNTELFVYFVKALVCFVVKKIRDISGKLIAILKT